MKRLVLFAFALALSAFLLPFTLVQTAAASEGASKTQSKPEIVMYATQTCGYCAKARAWFQGKNLAWQERDIEASADAHAEWKALGGRGTPLILVNGKSFQGFDQAGLEAELASTGQ